MSSSDSRLPNAAARAPGAPRGAPDTTELEAALAGLEAQIAGMGRALIAQDAAAAEAAAVELRTVLRAAMGLFAQVQRRGAMPPPLRRRFAQASGQIAAQREALMRATTALDQALDILLPRADGPAVYSSDGGAKRSSGRVIAAS